MSARFLNPSPHATAVVRPARAPRRRVDGVLRARQAVGSVVQRGAAARAPRSTRPRRRDIPERSTRWRRGCCRVCFGDATKFAQALLDSDKEYVATVRFGIATTTGDAEGSGDRARARRFHARRDRARAARVHRRDRAGPAAPLRAQVSTAAITTNTRAKASRFRARRASVDDPRARARSTGRRPTRCCASPAARAPTSACWPRTSAARSAAARISSRCGASPTGPFALAGAVTLDALEAMTPAGARCAAAAVRRAASRRCRGRMSTDDVARALRQGQRAERCRSGRARAVSLLRAEFRVPGDRRMLCRRAAGRCGCCAPMPPPDPRVGRRFSA